MTNILILSYSSKNGLPTNFNRFIQATDNLKMGGHYCTFYLPQVNTRSETEAQQNDGLLLVSTRSKTEAQQNDGSPQVNTRSKTEAQQSDGLPQVNTRSKTEAQQSDGLPLVGTRSKTEAQQSGMLLRVSTNVLNAGHWVTDTLSSVTHVRNWLRSA